MYFVSRIVSIVLILLLSTTVLQYGFSIGDKSPEKKMELCKKMTEDSSSEEDAGADSEEDSIEGEFYHSEINISKLLGESKRFECSTLPYGLGYWSISTPPPRI